MHSLSTIVQKKVLLQKAMSPPSSHLVAMGRLSPEESLNTVYRVRNGTNSTLKWYDKQFRYLKEKSVYHAIGPHPNVLPTRNLGGFDVGGFGILSPSRRWTCFNGLSIATRKPTVVWRSMKCEGSCARLCKGSFTPTARLGPLRLETGQCLLV